MNVKKHRCLVWVVMISLLLGTWNGSVARGEENNLPVETGKVRQITQVKLEMDELDEGHVGQKLPAVSVTEVWAQVETAKVDTATVESKKVEVAKVDTAAVESTKVETVKVDTTAIEQTISWRSRNIVNGEFESFNGDCVKNNTEYEVNITLKTESYIFMDGVEVCLGDGKPEEITRVSEKEIKVSRNFMVGTLASPPSAMPPETTTPPTSTPIVPPTATPTAPPVIQQPAVIDTLSVEGVVPPVGDQKFPKEELRVTTKFPDAIATIEPGWHSDSEPTEGIGEIAEFNKTYVLWIQLTAEVGYEFGEMLDPGVVKDINGIPIDKVEVEHDKENKGKVIIKCTFPTGPKPIQTPKVINKLYVEGVEAPVAGKGLPEGELEVLTNLRKEDHPEAIATIEPDWYSEEDKKIGKEETAILGNKYVLWIKLTAGNGYVFNEKLNRVEVSDKNDNLIENPKVVHDEENKGKVVIIKCTFEAGDNPDQPPSESPTAEPPTEHPSASPVATPPSALIPLVTPSTTYKVTLDANGGKFKNTKQKQKKITFTTEDLNRGGVDLPKKGEMTKKGCIFIGWYKEKTRVKEITEPGNITLKAQWVKASFTMKYPGGTFKWVNFKLDSNVKLTEVSIKEKKYRSFVKIDNKKKTIKGKKYFKKASLILKIDGEEVTGVVLKMKLPEVKIRRNATIKRRRYVIGVYTTYKVAYIYPYKNRAIKVEAKYSYKKNGRYKPCSKALNRPNGGVVNVEQGTTVFMKVRIYYGKGKNDYSESKERALRG